jgi:hypothetical protein
MKEGRQADGWESGGWEGTFDHACVVPTNFIFQFMCACVCVRIARRKDMREEIVQGAALALRPFASRRMMWDSVQGEERRRRQGREIE